MRKGLISLCAFAMVGAGVNANAQGVFGGQKVEPDRPVIRGATKLTAEKFSVTVNLPKALTVKWNADGEEVAQPLPPYAPTEGFPLAALTGVEKWDDNDPNTVDYVIPVKVGLGVWLDFRPNADLDRHVAIVPSIEGINAVDGKKTTRGISLTKYTDATAEGMPAQNFLSSSATSASVFWLDGFRFEDGAVRQFVITKRKGESVAQQVIGDERVAATIGIAFFTSKYAKPRSRGATTRGIDDLGAKGFSKGIGVGAGTRIRQRVNRDTNDLDYWNDKPAAIIRIVLVHERDLGAVLARSRPVKPGPFTGVKLVK